MVLKIVSFTILIQLVILSPEATTVLASIEISSVFNLYIITSLIIYDFPVLALNSIVHL